MHTSTLPADDDAVLDQAYPLPTDAVEAYRRDGFVTLRDVLPAATLARFADEFTRLVYDAIPAAMPLHQRDTYGKAFLQVNRIWRKSEAARRFVLAQRVGRIAAGLMGTRGVRLYHDQALYKEAQGGFTPWHCDQQYWPLASERTVTAWIPLQDTPLDMGPLAFAAGSHRDERGRHLAIGDESEAFLNQAMAGYPLHERPYALGDVSFHAGWTYHRARGNTTGRVRKVMTIIFMDVDMRLAEPANPHQQRDRQAWAPGIAVGDTIDSAENPVIWQQDG